jgi:hypothetical protein
MEMGRQGIEILPVCVSNRYTGQRRESRNSTSKVGGSVRGGSKEIEKYLQVVGGMEYVGDTVKDRGEYVVGMGKVCSCVVVDCV